MDWASRAVLSWRLSNTMDVTFCVAALEEAPLRFGKPQIFNTDQGSQFTSTAFTGTLERAGIQISMDGRGRWMDNVFIEPLWRSLKHEDVYLKGYADGRELQEGLANWIAVLTRRSAIAPDGGLAQRRRRKGCGHDGQRKSVADMPTAPTTAAAEIAFLAP
jgi:putative transposase